MKRLIVGLLAVILVLGVIGCGASESETQFIKDSSAGPAPVPEPMTPGRDSGGIAIPSPTIMKPPVEEGQGASYDHDDELALIDRMIIRTGDMQLVVEDVASSMEQITDLADTYEGWVVNSNSWQERLGQDESYLCFNEGYYGPGY